MKLTRRSFIKFLGIGAAVAALPKVTKQETPVEQHSSFLDMPDTPESYIGKRFPSWPLGAVIIENGSGERFVSYNFYTNSVPEWTRITEVQL